MIRTITCGAARLLMIAAAATMVLVLIASKPVAAGVFSGHDIVRPGFTDATHTGPDGATSPMFNAGFNFLRQAYGFSTRYVGEVARGQTAFVFDSDSRATIAVDSYSVQNTSVSGEKYSVVDAMNDARMFAGRSTLYRGDGTINGYELWRYNAENHV